MRAYEASSSGGLPDRTITAVFKAFPRNTRPELVLAKVAVLNSLYFTNILALRDVARAIAQAAIDPLLKRGAPEVLDALAKHTVGGRTRNHFSFATKYAHWHQPKVYPIFDRFVDEQLRAYQARDQFSAFHSGDLRTPDFLRIFEDFRSFYGLEACSLRAIDKWLWRQGKGISPSDAT